MNVSRYWRLWRIIISVCAVCYVITLLEERVANFQNFEINFDVTIQKLSILNSHFTCHKWNTKKEQTQNDFWSSLNVRRHNFVSSRLNSRSSICTLCICVCGQAKKPKRNLQFILCYQFFFCFQFKIKFKNYLQKQMQFIIRIINYSRSWIFEDTFVFSFA